MQKSPTELARAIVEKYIEIALKNKKQFSKKYLATVLYSENPDVYKDSEMARLYIRTVLQARGNRKQKKDDEIARRFALIPETINEVENTEPFIIPDFVKNALVIADIHGRFYDKSALEIAINDGVKHGCDSVIILGDYMDFYQDSKFDKDPSLAYIFEEQEWGQDVLSMLQDTFKYVLLKKGNHDVRREKRIERLLVTKPELTGLTNYQDYLFFEGSNVKFVEDYNHIVFGKLNMFHGHEYYGGGIHIAYNRLHKTFDNSISAHSHVTNSVGIKTINNEFYGSWTIGCLCKLFAKYFPKNNWNHGFARIEKENSGDFEVNNRRIINGKIFSA